MVAEARRRIVADLEAQGDLVGTQPHEMVVGRCERSDDIVEPRIKTQWFIRVAPMAERAMAAVREAARGSSPRFSSGRSSTG
ncbi:MAG: class I tRNA ligase family protein [Chloroflexota bacterium]